MKKAILVLTLFLVAAMPAYAKQHSSDFGFTMDIPDGWLVLGREEVKKNPDLFNFDNPQLSGMSKDVIADIRDKVQSGQVELYMHSGVGSDSFTNNVNVIKQTGQIPTNAAGVKKDCDAMPDAYAQAFGKPIKFYQCELRTVAGLNSIFVVNDGGVDGTIIVQYQIQKSDNVLLVITGTFTNQTLSRERPGFEAMVRTFKIR
jgi:hypothetical protein